ncbi:MAG TPA: S53 family peptidase [Solirubrobacteraceae bacterium]|nr:S53 family peptidase [Solirubrobacteraceae bacterium]
MSRASPHSKSRASVVSATARRAAALATALALTSTATAAAGARAALAASDERPLPAADYAVRPVCSPAGPSAAERARCLALALVPITPAARARSTPLGVLYTTPTIRARELAAARAAAHARTPTEARRTAAPGTAASSGLAAEGRYGLTPLDLHHAYALPETTPQAESQLVALVDAYADPKIESDLATFASEFGLPQCSAESHCLSVLDLRSPSEPLSRKEKEEQAEWDQEISLDVETVHAICTSCRILLVEAASSYVSALDEAESVAVGHGATEISNSWGSSEPSSEVEAFDHPGVAITAAAGDNGYRNWMLGPENEHVDYPAASPHVLAVGGTRLELGPSGEWLGERVWNGKGATAGGCAEALTAGGAPLFAAPAWQLALPDWPQVGCGAQRAVSDVAADADPYTGIAIYDSVSAGGVSGWQTIGGTSLASPIIAATIALAGGVAPEYKYVAEPLYENAKLHPSALHGVSEGSNGECKRGYNAEDGLSLCTTAEEGESCAQHLICVAGSGFSGPVGLGTPHGYSAFAKPGSIPAPSEEPGTGSGAGSGASTTTTTTASTSSGTAATLSESTSAQTTTTALATSTTTASTTTASAGRNGSEARAAQVARLWLAPRTRRALRSKARRPRLRQIAFRALLSRPQQARALLYRLLRSAHGRLRLRALGSPLLLAAGRVRIAGHLRGRLLLAPGRYRLVLVLASGSRRALAFSVG